ncbi:fatty acid metabolism regulator [Geomonas sp. Red32]|uniref:GntR family transcriptional regulator n=1 Tax=Geomonas sp. Red32 TaxID=2912856 RepID=UPI00202CF924|nr:GntR family transcriptional regulator [Geomonas sp. Red32]MCM0081424.1 fatty acid metabolism regulator [Geomonas sp. Red32]
MRKTYQMVERALVAGLLSGEVRPGGTLQSERDLAARFAVSRATVREALLKLQESGWISVHQRRSTIVNDFWSQGDLQLLSSINRNSEAFPRELALHLMELRVQFAPDYARRAVENEAPKLAELLTRASKLRNTPGSLVKFDSQLHLTMAVLSGNKLYPLIMNSFTDLYQRIKGEFFSTQEHRSLARNYYEELLVAAQAGDPLLAEQVTRKAMALRLESYQRV